MQWPELMQLARQGDSSSLKFLGNTSNEDDIFPFLVGMANSNGGKIVIGIDVMNFHLLGTFIDKPWLDKMINEHCYPFVPFIFDVINRNEKRIVCVTVEESTHKPFYFKKKCYVMEKKEPNLVLEEDEKHFHPSPLHKKPPQLSRLSVIDTDSAPEPPQEETPVLYNTPLQTSVKEDARVLTPNEANQNEPDQSEQMSIDPSIQVEPVSSTATVTVSTPPLNETVEQSHMPIPSEQTNLSLLTNEEPEKVLTSRQKKVLKFLKYHETIKNKEYRELYHVSHKTAHLELVDLLDRGLLVQQGAGRSTCYLLINSDND